MPKRDWAKDENVGALDLMVAAAGVGLVLLAVVMMAADYARELDSAAALRVTGETRPLDPAYRMAYMPYALAAVVFVSGAVLWRALRVRQSPFLRRHASRPLMLLFLGSAILDAAYYADTTFGLRAPHAVRAVLIDPAYALAGVVLAGAAWRMRSLVRPLPVGDTEA